MIAIVDTGGANLASLQNAFARLGESSIVSADKSELEKATCLVLPGVGHAQLAMARLKEKNLIDFIREQKKPVLGICLGMQLLYTFLEEGQVGGLGLLPGTVGHLEATDTFRVPHMGWSSLEKVKSQSQLLKNISPSASFYFVHSFAAPMGAYVVASSTSPQPIPAVIEFNNFFATQFHPEKSAAPGNEVLKNFLSVVNSERSN